MSKFFYFSKFCILHVRKKIYFLYFCVILAKYLRQKEGKKFSELMLSAKVYTFFFEFVRQFAIGLS